MIPRILDGAFLTGCFYWLLAAAPLASGAPTITAVVNGASFEPLAAPGTLIVIYGKELAAGPLSAPEEGPLPTTLGGTSVTIGGTAAELYYVSATEVRAVIPLTTPTTGSVGVVVTSGGVASQSFPLKVELCAPAIFTRDGTGKGLVSVYDADNNQLSEIAPRAIVTFLATGLGSVMPAADGSMRVTFLPSVFIGESPAPVISAKPGNRPGVYEVKVFVGDPLVTERFYMVQQPASFRSNVVQIGIPGGQNALNVSGSIQPLYPIEGALVTYSPLLRAARIRASFEIAPDALPFMVAAVSDTGSALFQVDPYNWRISFLISAPNYMEKMGSFSSETFTTSDFLSGGNAFPGNIVPASRQDPKMQQALNLLPWGYLEWTADGSRDAGNYWQDGENYLPSDGVVIIDDYRYPPNTFGNFAAVPYAPHLASRTTNFSLYIDGRRVDSAQANYSVPKQAGASRVAWPEQDGFSMTPVFGEDPGRAAPEGSKTESQIRRDQR